MREKNIFIIQNTEIGGSLALSVFLTNLLNFYNKDKYNLNLICGKIENEQAIKEIKSKFNIFTLNTGLYKIIDNIKFAFKTFFILKKENKKKEIDILHCFYPNSSLMGIYFFRIFINRKVKTIYDIRSPWIEMSFENNHLSKKRGFLKKIMHFSEKVLTKKVNYFVFITEGLKNYYREKYKLNYKNNFSIIPTGVDVKKFNINLNQIEKKKIKKELEINNEQIIIGYVGTLSKLRKIPEFIENNIDEIKNNNLKFIFIGDGDDFLNIKETVKNNNLTEKFIFLGKMPQNELIQYLQIFDYGLANIPNLFIFENSFPLKVLEYIASGKKVLATKLKAHKEIKKFFDNEIIIYNKKIDFSKLEKQKGIEINQKIYDYDWGNLYNKYEVIYDGI